MVSAPGVANSGSAGSTFGPGHNSELFNSRQAYSCLSARTSAFKTNRAANAGAQKSHGSPNLSFNRTLPLPVTFITATRRLGSAG